MKEYGIDYTVLLGGTQDERDTKLTQPVNLNSWPTTFFLGLTGAYALSMPDSLAPPAASSIARRRKSSVRRWKACWRKS